MLSQEAVEFTLLRKPWSDPPRPLPIALGQLLANVSMRDTSRLMLLGRTFNSLRPGDKLRCQVELQRCRMAKRGQIKAEVV